MLLFLQTHYTVALSITTMEGSGLTSSSAVRLLSIELERTTVRRAEVYPKVIHRLAPGQHRCEHPYFLTKKLFRKF